MLRVRLTTAGWKSTAACPIGMSVRMGGGHTQTSGVCCSELTGPDPLGPLEHRLLAAPRVGAGAVGRWDGWGRGEPAPSGGCPRNQGTGNGNRLGWGFFVRNQKQGIAYMYVHTDTYIRTYSTSLLPRTGVWLGWGRCFWGKLMCSPLLLQRKEKRVLAQGHWGPIGEGSGPVELRG